MKFEDLFPGEDIETDELEFKGILNEGTDPKTKEDLELPWLKTIVAFSNGQGGRLYVGVEDKTHKIDAFDHETCDKQIRLLRREAEQRIVPPLRLNPKAIPLSFPNGTRYLIEVTVPHSPKVPVMVKSKGVYGTYIRRFGQTDSATPDEITELVLNSQQVSFDSLPSEVLFRHEDFSLLQKEYVLHKKGTELLDKTLMLKGFFDREGRLTKGALLFRDDCDDPKTKLSVVKWPGVTRGSSDLLSVNRLQGPITRCIHEATALVMSLSTNGIRKTAQGEEKLFSYPERSVSEGIANAYAHKNYWAVGSQIQVDIFLDRIEITSPGSWVGGESFSHKKDIGSLVPLHRNALIAEILALVGDIQGLGTGLDKIAEDYASADEAHKPFIASDSSRFVLTLPDLLYRGGVVGEDNPDPEIYVEGDGLSANEIKVLRYCYPKKRSVSQIASYLGVSVSSYFKKGVLQGLVEKGYLIQVDERPATYYANHGTVFLKP